MLLYLSSPATQGANLIVSAYKDRSDLGPEILGIFSPSDCKTDSACIRMGKIGGAGGRPLGSKDKEPRARKVESAIQKAAKDKRKQHQGKKARREGANQMQAALMGGQGTRAVNAAPEPRSAGFGEGGESVGGAAGGAAGGGSVGRPSPATHAASVAQEGDGQGAAGGTATDGADFDTVVQESIRVQHKHVQDSAGMVALNKQEQLHLLKKKLQQLNLECVDVQDKGNCFFESVIWQYEHTVKHPVLPFMASIQSLRDELARWYRENHQHLDAFFPDYNKGDWDQHVLKIATDGEWPDASDITAVATLINCTIRVVPSAVDQGLTAPLTIDPPGMLPQKRRIGQRGANKQKRAAPRCTNCRRHGRPDEQASVCPGRWPRSACELQLFVDQGTGRGSGEDEI